MMPYTKIDLGQYIVISIWFGCNNNCTICMLSELKKELPAIGYEQFKKVLIDIKNHGRFENLILSGAEVTTFDGLDKYVEFAASLGWFKKIQIQTNGRRLKDKDYLKHLIDCGVNEFFISIHGLNEIHDTTTRTPGSFKESLEGLRNLADFDVNVISNTVLTKRNYNNIPHFIEFLAQEKVSEIHLWNFFPMEKTDSRDLVVSMKDFVVLLPKIFSIVKSCGKVLVLKSFPECLSMGEPGFFDSLFPVTLLPDRFWMKFSECGFGMCVYRDKCKARECWGLSSAYVQKYGDERELLSPII